jgi:uncharacterized DUF497 family protein
VDYEWDETKRRSNLAKHGVDFAQVSAFEWGSVQEQEDRRKNYGERRWIGVGKIDDLAYVLIYTRRSGRVRVISLRKASQREFRRYEANAQTTDR